MKMKKNTQAYPEFSTQAVSSLFPNQTFTDHSLR